MDSLQRRSPIRCLRLPSAVLAAVLLAMLAPPAPSAAQPLEPDARKAIHTVIAKQIAAFRDDDGPAAFALASPTIQRLFRTPEQFMRMVRRDYHPVYRPRRVVFMELALREGQPVQRVLIYSPEGGVLSAYYVMQRLPSGEWRINGVFLRSGERQSV
jgi:hypothetical protein